MQWAIAGAPNWRTVNVEYRAHARIVVRTLKCRSTAERVPKDTDAREVSRLTEGEIFERSQLRQCETKILPEGTRCLFPRVDSVGGGKPCASFDGIMAQHNATVSKNGGASKVRRFHAEYDEAV